MKKPLKRLITEPSNSFFSLIHWRASRPVPAEEFFYHLHSDSLFVLHLWSHMLLPSTLLALITLRIWWTITHRTVSTFITLLSKWHHHDPVGIWMLTCTLLPHANVSILWVEPQAGHGRRWKLPTLSKLCMKNLFQFLWGWRNLVGSCLRLWITLWCLDHWKIGFCVSATHQNRSLVVCSCCFFCCFKRP